MSIHSLVVSYGYIAVFLLVAVESLGVPLPGETALVAAATLAGLDHHLSVWGVFAVGAAGAVIGDTVGYWVGDKGGYRLLRRYGRYVRIDEPKIKVARYLFARHGGAVVFFGRFVSVLRTYAAFLAGTTRMRYRRFLVFNASGGILWAAAYTFAAYYAGSTLSKVSTPVSVAFGAAAVVVVVVGVLLVRRRMSALIDVAEKAFPGPLEPPGSVATTGEAADGDREEAGDHGGRAAPPAGEGRHPPTAGVNGAGGSRHSAR